MALSKSKYVLAFLITAGIFSLGLLLGLVIEAKRVDFLTFYYQDQRLDIQSLQLQNQFADQFTSQRDCNGLLKTFDNSLLSLERARERIESYKKDASFNDNEFDLLKREYTLAQISYWLLYIRTKEICGLDSSTILYFFGDETSCADCEDQAVVLTWLKHKLGTKLLNFVFDGTYAEREPIVKLMKSIHNVTSYPTLVINGKTVQGFMGRKEILLELCPLYPELADDVCA
jgi:hypothetical protein